MTTWHTELSDDLRDEIIIATTSADLCCPEAVCDALMAVAEQDGDWRAELARAVANDAVERRALDID